MSVWTSGPGVELTVDRSFTRRVRRLVWISLIALGAITWLAFQNGAPAWVRALMITGWLLMPTLLALSIGNPKLRYGLLVPGAAFCVAVIGMALDSRGTQSVGWWIIAAGLTVGGSAGLWFWMRWLPVPRPFDDPYGVARLAVIGVHVALVLAGMAAVIAA